MEQTDHSLKFFIQICGSNLVSVREFQKNEKKNKQTNKSTKKQNKTKKQGRLLLGMSSCAMKENRFVGTEQNVTTFSNSLFKLVEAICG